jgi:hypothetical protein
MPSLSPVRRDAPRAFPPARLGLDDTGGVRSTPVSLHVVPRTLLAQPRDIRPGPCRRLADALKISSSECLRRANRATTLNVYGNSNLTLLEDGQAITLVFLVLAIERVDDPNTRCFEVRTVVCRYGEIVRECGGSDETVLDRHRLS